MNTATLCPRLAGTSGPRLCRQQTQWAAARRQQTAPGQFFGSGCLFSRPFAQATAPRLAKKPARKVVALPSQKPATPPRPKPEPKPKAAKATTTAATAAAAAANKPRPSEKVAEAISQGKWYAPPIANAKTAGKSASSQAPETQPKRPGPREAGARQVTAKTIRATEVKPVEVRPVEVKPKEVTPPPPPPVPPKQPKKDKDRKQDDSNGDSQKQPLSQLLSQRKTALVGAALAAGVLGFYISPLLVTYLSGGCRGDGGVPPEDIAPDAVPTGLPPVSASEFDASLDMPEWVTGVTKLRKELAAEARGAVLEVAVGTGRNVDYLPWAIDAPPQEGDAKQDTAAVTSFTGVDLSEGALEIARQRLRSSVPGAKAVIRKKTKPAEESSGSGDDTADSVNRATPKKAAPAVATEFLNVFDGRVRLFHGDATKPLPPATGAGAPASSSFSLFRSSFSSSSSPPAKYDTVIQTFGICSVGDPVALLANMAAVVRPDTGRIVLLEHGRGKWGVVNSLLDKYAGGHFVRFGCWWNRDLQAIVDEAAAKVPGLEVVDVQRPGRMQFGTLWRIELRVVSPSSASKA